jgi:hypothetical protein
MSISTSTGRRPTLINQLTAPGLTLEQGMPHLLIDLARRLAAGQQARVLFNNCASE